MSILPEARNVRIDGGVYWAIGRDAIFHYHSPGDAGHDSPTFREAHGWVTSFLLRSLSFSLNWGTSDGETNFTVLIDWSNLPPKFAMEFPQPVAVEFRNRVFAKAHIDHSFRVTANSPEVPANFTITNESGFKDFASAILMDEEVKVVLKAEQIRLSTGTHDSVDGDYTLQKHFVIKGRHCLRALISFRNFKIRGSDKAGSYLKVTTDVEITNQIPIHVKITNLTLGAYYRGTRIGFSEVKEYTLEQGRNVMDVNWKFEKQDDPDGDFIHFVNRYTFDADGIPISYKVERMRVNICSSPYDLPGPDIPSVVHGLITTTNPRLDLCIRPWRYLFGKWIKCRFICVNSIDAPLEIRNVDAVSYSKGVALAKIKHTYRSFIIPGGQEGVSESIKDVVLVQPLFTYWGIYITNYGNTYDVKILSSTVRIENFEISVAGEYNGVPIRLHWGF